MEYVKAVKFLKEFGPEALKALVKMKKKRCSQDQSLDLLCKLINKLVLSQ